MGEDHPGKHHGGIVINTAGVTLAHGMEHPASGLKNIVHGQGLAALTPVIIEHPTKETAKNSVRSQGSWVE